MGVIVRILGPLEVICQERPLHVTGARGRALLAVLAANAGRLVPTESLVDGLWEADRPGSAPSLRTVATRLVETFAGAGDVVIVEPSGFRLAPEVDVDLTRFERLSSRGRAELTKGRYDHAAGLLRDALALFRGEPLAGVTGPMARVEASRLAEARLVALASRVEADLGCGLHGQLIEELQRLTATFPYREELWEARIRALYRSGRRDDALSASGEFRRLLAETLGEKPSGRLQQLEEMVRVGDPMLVWVPQIARAAQPGVVLPVRSGVATYLFTDLVESTANWSYDARRMSHVLLRHNALIAEGVERHNGRVAKHTGDGVIAVFVSAVDAIRGAVDAQRSIAAEDWGPIRIGVRMGIHSGVAEFFEGDVYGLTINTAARLEDAAHGGQILVSGITVEFLEGPLPDDIRLRSLGERLFRGVHAPLKVFQVCHPDLQQTFPEIRCRRPSSGIPKPSTPYFDPRGYADSVRAALHHRRLVTLTGPGGVGKSRLAVEVCSGLASTLEEGVCWVNLSPVDQSDLVAQAIASDLQVSAADGDTVKTLVDHLEHQNVLLVLDNCERHVQSIRTLAASILHQCPDVRIIATTRELLHLADEQVIEVAPLNAANDPSLLDVAVDLFSSSAAASGVTLPPSTRPQLQEVCREIDGLPLAIELAAAQLSTMSLQELQRHLRERIRVLTSRGGRRVGEPEHHQAMSATVQWSYDQLSPELQNLLEGLAVFRGGFTAEAVSKICYPDPADEFEAWEELSELTRKSLVMSEPDRPVTRFSLLETIRAFASERLQAQDRRESTQRRHAYYYADLAESADRGRGGPDEAVWVAIEQEELANFRAAVAWAKGAGDVGVAIRTYVALYELAAFQGCVEVFDWIDPADYGATDHELLAAALAMSSIRHGPGEPASLETAAWAVRLQQERGLRNHRLLPWALGFAEASMGNSGAAEAAYEEAARLIRDIEGENGRWITAQSLHPRESRSAAEEMLVQARRIGQPTGLANALVALARTIAPSEPDAALRLIERASDLAQSVRNVRQLTQNELAAASIVRRADPQAAIGYLVSALTYAVDLRQNETVWRSVTSLLTVLLGAGYEEEAAELAVMWSIAYPEAVSRYPIFGAALRGRSSFDAIAWQASESDLFDKTFELLGRVRRVVATA